MQRTTTAPDANHDAETSYTSIAAYRKATGVSQTDLADKLGITQSALSMIERGDRMPRPELLAKITTTCHVPIKALLRKRMRRQHEQTR